LDFSIMKLLLTCFSAFALFCHVHAGFCDDKSGRFCRTKEGYGLVSTFCSCKYKRRRLSKKKSSYGSYSKYKYKSLKRDCDSVEDRPCTNGCGGGVCLSASQVCATTALNELALHDGSNVQKLSTTCPMVTQLTYKTWKDRQQNTDPKELVYLKNTLNANNAWSKANLAPKFYANATKGDSTPDAVSKAWDANCKSIKTDVQQMNCRSYFPKCVLNRGSNSECIAYCNKAMQCVKAVKAACDAANTKDPTNCKPYPDFGPRGGEPDCALLCKENQNDFVKASTGSTLGSFMSVAIAFAISFIM